MHIQLYLKELSKSGVLLAIVSKNDKALVAEFFAKRSDMPLSLADFVACEASWDRKSSTIGRILKTLKLRAQDCAFLDDSVHERAEVASVLPEIRLLDIPSDIFKRLLFLEKALPISREPSTEEDKDRLSFYKQMNLREKDRQYTHLRFKGEQDPLVPWLYSLNTWLTLSCITSETVDQRVSQLYGRTNQFNMTGNHPTSGSIADHLELGNILITGTVGDKYGNDGIAISAIIKDVGKSLIFQEFVMSCRIIGRFVEDAFVMSICKRFCEADHLVFRFKDSGKNSTFMTFRDRMFILDKNNCEDRITDNASVEVSALESRLSYGHVIVEWN
jgi:FkbH-like protein